MKLKPGKRCDALPSHQTTCL